MPITPVVGPAGGGKSQWIARNRQPGDITIDHTAIWAALTGAVRGPDGRYPAREVNDPTTGLVQYLMAVAVRQATASGLSGIRHDIQARKGGGPRTGNRGARRYR